MLKDLLSYMSNLRQKHKTAGLTNQQSQDQIVLLSEISKQLQEVIGLLTDIKEQTNNTQQHVVIKEVSANSKDILQENYVEDKTPDFIPSIDIEGMTASHKGVSTKSRTRDVSKNLQKLKELNSGDNDG